MFNELGIERITIDLPFRLNHVHCFLAKGENGWKIIDTGLHNDVAIKKWELAIGEKNITDIYITHYHPDHLGYAGQLQKEKRANVWITKTDVNSMERLTNKELRDKGFQHYVQSGIPEDTVIKLVNMNPMIFPLPNISGFLQEGDKISFGKLEYEVIFTPGHADGLICLYNQKEKILFSTDHILPSITPNISYTPFGEQDPLRLFFDSLEKIKIINNTFSFWGLYSLFFLCIQLFQKYFVQL